MLLVIFLLVIALIIDFFFGPKAMVIFVIGSWALFVAIMLSAITGPGGSYAIMAILLATAMLACLILGGYYLHKTHSPLSENSNDCK